VASAVVAVCLVSIASSDELPRVSLRDTEVRTIQSRHVDQEYEIEELIPFVDGSYRTIPDDRTTSSWGRTIGPSSR
jgi:hypothetical protein